VPLRNSNSVATTRAADLRVVQPMALGRQFRRETSSSHVGGRRKEPAVVPSADLARVSVDRDANSPDVPARGRLSASLPRNGDVLKSFRFAPHPRVAVEERGRINAHKSLRIRSEYRYLSALVPRGTEYVAAHGSCHAENLGRSEVEGLVICGAFVRRLAVRVALHGQVAAKPYVPSAIEHGWGSR